MEKKHCDSAKYIFVIAYTIVIKTIKITNKEYA